MSRHEVRKVGGGVSSKSFKNHQNRFSFLLSGLGVRPVMVTVSIISIIVMLLGLFFSKIIRA